MDIKIIKIGKIIDIMVFHVACPFSLSNSFFFKKNNVVKTDKNKEINIKGVFDNRYFEELDSPLQYLVDGKLQWDFPENPYKKGTARYANYREMPISDAIVELSDIGALPVIYRAARKIVLEPYEKVVERLLKDRKGA